MRTSELWDHLLGRSSRRGLVLDTVVSRDMVYGALVVDGEYYRLVLSKTTREDAIALHPELDDGD